jgi:integral membrane protein
MTSDPRKLLNTVLIVGVIDFLLLLVLLYMAWIEDDDGAVSILGPIHGIGFLALLYLTFRGALEQFWGWWFPAIVLVTGGPVGTLVGEVVLRRRLRPAAATG